VTSRWLLRSRAALPAALSSVAAVAAALLVGAAVIAISGQDAVLAYKALAQGAFLGKRAVAETLIAATPLIFGGLSFAIAARGGLFNIGIEGEMMLGGLAAGLIGGLKLGLPLAVHLPLALLAAVVAGGIWGLIPGVLKARTGAHEVITTIMLNYIAFRISSWAVGAANLLDVDPSLQATNPVVPSAQLPRFLAGTRLHAGLLLALAATVILAYVLFRTTLGYKIRVVGLSRGAADYAGIRWGVMISVAMLLSGILAGLGGASQVLGLQRRYYDQSSGYGFTAIAVGLVGKNNPFGVVLAGLLFGVLTSGANRMQSEAGTPKEIVQVLQGLVILSVAAFAAFEHVRRRRTRFLGRRGAPTVVPAQDVGMMGEGG